MHHPSEAANKRSQAVLHTSFGWHIAPQKSSLNHSEQQHVFHSLHQSDIPVDAVASSRPSAPRANSTVSPAVARGAEETPGLTRTVVGGSRTAGLALRSQHWASRRELTAGADLTGSSSTPRQAAQQQQYTHGHTACQEPRMACWPPLGVPLTGGGCKENERIHL